MLTMAQSDANSGHVAPAGVLHGDAPVYAIGALGFDFVDRERRDAHVAENGGRPILTAHDLHQYLTRRGAFALSESEGVLWTLTRGGCPLYAIRPRRPLAAQGFAQRVLELLGDPAIDRIAVPGVLSGTIALLDGTVVPIIDPDLNGIRSWSGSALAGAIGLTGSCAVPLPAPFSSPPTVDLTAEGVLDWICWSHVDPGRSPHKQGSPALARAPLGALAGGKGMISQYAGATITCRWNDGAGGQLRGSSDSGLGVSAAGGGLELSLPAGAAARTLRLYARTFASTGLLTAALDDGSASTFVDSSFNAFPAFAGLPGVVDGVYAISYRAARDCHLLVRLAGAPTMATPSPLAVTLHQSPEGGAPTQTLGVGAWAASHLGGVRRNLGSVHVPRGLRLTLYTEDDHAGEGVVLTATVGGAVAKVPAELRTQVQSLIVEPESYVGFQAATLQEGMAGARGWQSFMDRFHRLLENGGATAEERAVNFAATQAVVTGLLASPMGAGLVPKALRAEPARFSRPGAESWDVVLTFVHPLQLTQEAETVVRMSVDVAGVKPVVIAGPRKWTRY